MGVASLITPYNLPITLNLFKVGPALAAGCTVILKPSPYTPLEALILGEVADEADLPPGVLNIVTGDVDAGLQLTTNPNVDMVSFTGSDTVGRKIAAQAASSVKKVVLELGGKSANILCDDTDLDRALMDVVQNFTFHCGQGCGLLTRVLVHESLHDELVGRIEAVLDSIVVGDGADPRVTMGPLISEAQRHKVESLIRAGRDEGATLAYGGGRPDGLSKGSHRHGFDKWGRRLRQPEYAVWWIQTERARPRVGRRRPIRVPSAQERGLGSWWLPFG